MALHFASPHRWPVPPTIPGIRSRMSRVFCPKACPTRARLSKPGIRSAKCHRMRWLRFTRYCQAPGAPSSVRPVCCVQHLRRQAFLRRRHDRQGHGRQQTHWPADLHEDGAGAGRPWLRGEQESADLRLCQRAGIAQLHRPGLGFGGQANLSAMVSGQGSMFTGAAAISPGVYLYQLTDTGLSATLTVSGTRFFKDGDLN